MAVLPDTDRALVSAEFMRRVKSAYGGITKPQLLAAVNATDQWQDDNQAAYNTALPVAARTGLSANEKTLLYCYVALKRAGLL